MWYHLQGQEEKQFVTVEWGIHSYQHPLFTTKSIKKAILLGTGQA